MAYPADVSSVQLVTPSTAEFRIWAMKGTDAVTAVRVDGYISDGADYGMGVGDVLWYVDTNASPVTLHTFIVTSVDAATRAVDLSDGLAVTATDTD